MTKRLFPILTVLLAGLLTGCLEFEGQTLSYRYDKGSDTLRVFQNYHGIYGGDAKGKAGKPLSEQEVEQLRSVLKGQRTYFFDNWLSEFNRADVEESLADLKDPAKRAEKNIPAEGVAKLEKLLRLLLDNVKIENGPFYLDADQRLCGVQAVTVTRFSKIVAALNECAPILVNLPEDEPSEPADREAVARFAKAGEKILLHEGNALTMRWPISRQSFDEEFGPEADDADRVAELRAAGIAINHADGVVSFRLGKSDDETSSLALEVNREGRYVPNLIEPARRQHVVKEKFDPAAAARKFLLQTE